MKVSLNTIKQYTTVDLSVDELVKKINQQLGGVEEVIDLGAKYKNAVIVAVAKCEKHPNADRLNVCLINDGGFVKDIERDEDNLIQVVCGAPNVRGGMLAIWLPPGSVVPASFDDKEPFVLEPKELRGVMSNGMLASAKELDLGESHDGILEINQDDLAPHLTFSDGLIGKSFAEVFGLDDTIIDIENKMFTHRPDLFGQIGVAREIAGIQHKEFTSPDWYKDAPKFKKADGLKLEVFNDAPENVPRFMAVAIKGVEVKPSPLWLQCALVAMGSKPINNIVDVTNYVMLLTAQPTHAYDYDKLRGNKLGTRVAKKGEKVELLNGKTYELDETDIVVVDGDGVVGLGGIMGGGNSEVSSETKNIVLEVANFDMYTVRKSSMRHGVFTDALARFNKGQSPLQNPNIMNLLMMSIFDVSTGKQASDVFDENTIGYHGNSSLEVTPAFINERLGLNLTAKEMASLLQNVEMIVSGGLKITPPFWRTDIELPEDIIEEIGRLYGFDKLPRELPTRSTKPAAKNAKLVLKQKIRESLARAGANEVLTYSFVHENVMKKAEQDSRQAFKLSNALSPDLQYYRLSVLPSLLDKVHGNIKTSHDEFCLFEIGKGHNKKFHMTDDNGLPSELEFVDAVYASKVKKSGAAYYHMRKLATQLADELGFTLKFVPIEKPLDFPVTAPFDQTRSAMVETHDGIFIGIVGELKQSVRRAFKLPVYTAAMTLDPMGLQKAHETPHQTYSPLSKFPSISQDISLKVATDTTYEDVFQAAWSGVKNTEYDAKLSPLSIYQSETDDDHKTITLRLKLTSSNRTLSADEASQAMTAIGKAARKAVGAQIV